MTNVIQAFWHSSGRFIVVGENRSLNNPAPLHPLAISHESLNQIFELIDFEPDGTDNIEVSIPCQDGRPLSSFIQPGSKAPSESGVFSYPAASFDPLSAAAFLTSLPAKAPEGIEFGETISFWLESTKFGLESMCRGHILPWIEKSTNTLESKWVLYPATEESKAKLDVLKKALPPILWYGFKSADSRYLNPAFPLTDFLNAVTDALVRMFLSRHELLSTPAESVTELWLNSLASRKSEFCEVSYQTQVFEQHLSGWIKEAKELGGDDTFYLRLKLVEPGFESGNWLLKVALSNKSGSKTIDYESLWNDFDLQQFEELETKLLTALSGASRIFPPMSKALEELTVKNIELTTPQAYNFMSDAAERLKAQEVLVELPIWWKQTNQEISISLSLDEQRLADGSSGSSIMGLENIFTFSWQAAVGDETLTEAEFNELLSSEAPLAHLKGQWVVVPHNVLTRTKTFFEGRKDKSSISLLEALQLQAGIGSEKEILSIKSIKASGAISDFFTQAKETANPQPEGFRGELRPYQLHGLNWLRLFSSLGLGACLADDMGLGKTIQVLAYLLERKINLGKDFGPILLIAPLSILDNWKSEAEKFTPEISTLIHHGPQRRSPEQLQQDVQNHDLVITTYSLAYREEDSLSEIDWKTIILDEAQNIKNSSSKQTQAIKRLSKECPIRIALTGTPLENRLDELWSIFDFLNKGLLGGESAFRSNFSIPIERYRDEDTAERLSRLVRPFILRRLKSDPKVISDLPEKLEMDVNTKLSHKQASMYQDILKSALPDIETSSSAASRRGNILKMITQLKQVCDHPSLVHKDLKPTIKDSGKMLRMIELLEVLLAEGDKTLIFSQFASMGTIMQKILSEHFSTKVAFLHGKLSKEKRDEQVKLFKESGMDCPIFVLSLKVGGFGLNLTEATQVIHFDQWWNPAVHSQATDRAHRIGQKSRVQVRTFICQGTLEERINSLLKEKVDLADSILGAGGTGISELPLEELRKIISLEERAVMNE